MDVLAWLVLTALCVVSLGFGVVLVQLLRQHGRILLRLENLEESIELAGYGPNAGLSEEPEGLPVGSALPSVRLARADGQRLGLDDFDGRRLILVNWSHSCSFCREISGALSEYVKDLRERGVELLLIASGGDTANGRVAEDDGVGVPVLVAEGNAFGLSGTPVAYLLDERHRTAAPLAVGADEVLSLVRSAARGERAVATVGSSRRRSVSESRIERNGLPAGSVAPPFALPTLDGTTLSLADYRGQRLLLVFSDPACGPCDELAPELARLHERRAPDEPAIVMVSRRGLDENRRKRDEHGLGFPIAIQAGWRLSRQYGIFMTPVAFLIDEEGVIARGVAIGGDAILALARSTAPRWREVRIEV